MSLTAPPMVFDPGYVTPLPAGHRFPMPKFALLAEVVVAEGLVTREALVRPTPATFKMLARVHDGDYLRAFREGALPHDAVRRAGLPWTADLVRRSVLAVGGTVKTLELALEHGLACNLAGGTHHAHTGFASGFCLLNDLAVAAAHALAEGWVDQVLVLDLDVHQGDGTATIFADDPRVFTCSLHCDANFPLRKAASDLDVSVPAGMGDNAYLALLRDGDGRGFDGIAALLERVEPDVVLYDAGVDVHHGDKLGKLALTDAGLFARDRFVIETALAQGVPVACVIGGGYDDDLHRLASRHATLHRAAAAVWADHAARGPTAGRVRLH